jgi:hypothetical protein
MKESKTYSKPINSKRNVLLSILFMFTFALHGQSKLELLTIKCNKRSETEMFKFVQNEKIRLMNENKDLINLNIYISWQVIGSDCKTILTDAEQQDNIYLLTGQYAFKCTYFADGEFVNTIYFTNDFTAKAKSILDDFVISEFEQK